MFDAFQLKRLKSYSGNYYSEKLNKILKLWYFHKIGLKTESVWFSGLTSFVDHKVYKQGVQTKCLKKSNTNPVLNPMLNDGIFKTVFQNDVCFKY